MKHPVTERPPRRANAEPGLFVMAPADEAVSVEELRGSRERYRAISETVADWGYSLLISSDGKVELAWTNLDAARVTGYTEQELDNRVGWFDLVHPSDRPSLDEHLAALLAGRNDVVEYRLLTKSGEVRWIRDYARPLRERDNGAMQVVGGVRDITTRRHAEFDRARLISELEATNEELERMAISVSKELEDSLAVVAAVLPRIDSRLPDGDPGLNVDVRRAHEAVLRLRCMLESLRELARIGHLPETLETVELGELAQQALDLCRDAIQAGDVHVTIGELPRVFGDRIRLLQLIRILVENSVRYMGDQPEPVLEIGSESRRGRNVIYVRDNGTGIDPGDLERVFDVFRRLDPRSSGTGVGLALARRIAEMHGGCIRAESEGRMRGSTFYVDLPA